MSAVCGLFDGRGVVLRHQSGCGDPLPFLSAPGWADAGDFPIRCGGADHRAEGFQREHLGRRSARHPVRTPKVAQAYLDKWGLGLWNPEVSGDVGVHGQVQLDGKNGGEYLRLEFAEPVQLTYLTFASVGLSDRFDLWADGEQVDLGARSPTNRRSDRWRCLRGTGRAMCCWRARRTRSAMPGLWDIRRRQSQFWFRVSTG